jgi:hypothetical protein
MPPPDTTVRRRAGFIAIEDEETNAHHEEAEEVSAPENVQSHGWHALASSFAASGALTFFAYFFPAIFSIPLFGSYLAREWAWTFTPSLAYVGQGEFHISVSYQLLEFSFLARDHHGSDFVSFASFSAF